MDINNWLNQVKDLGASALSKVTGALDDGINFVKSTIGDIPFLGSTESSSTYDDEKVDEKHYFLVPDISSRIGYSLHVMRCLPEGVPPINDLPKQRVMHLPSKHAIPLLEKILVVQAQDEAEAGAPETNLVSNSLDKLVDEIDKVDGKAFNGALLIGGLVALVNPMAGAALAAKAIVPSVGMVLSKYGLKYASEAATNYDISKRIKNAEKEVLEQFKESQTSKVENPLLLQLDNLLFSDKGYKKQKLQFSVESKKFSEQDHQRFLDLTYQAVFNVYEDTIDKNLSKDDKSSEAEQKYIELLKVLIASKKST